MLLPDPAPVFAPNCAPQRDPCACAAECWGCIFATVSAFAALPLVVFVH